jgi:hypothetical protein
MSTFTPRVRRPSSLLRKVVVMIAFLIQGEMIKRRRRVAQGLVQDVGVLENSDGADLVGLWLGDGWRARDGRLGAELKGRLLGAVLGDHLQGDAGPLQVRVEQGALGRRGDGDVEGLGATITDERELGDRGRVRQVRPYGDGQVDGLPHQRLGTSPVRAARAPPAHSGNPQSAHGACRRASSASSLRARRRATAARPHELPESVGLAPAPREQAPFTCPVRSDRPGCRAHPPRTRQRRRRPLNSSRLT